MAKQLNIDLSFNADASKAKAQIMDLQRSLDQLISSTINNNKQLGIDKEIKQAIDDATKLKVALQAATDANTGKLNLAKFSESLKNGQMTLQQYAQHLKALGPEGEQSFLKLSKAIVSAETPMRQTNTLLNQMFVTLKNTAKWQISSSIIHGLQSGLQQAFNYAQNLDTSLNNIRIVTGYSVDEMAKFAGEANKAAQALSTTTTSYTDAALIYYQQGIRDQDEIAARTETTIKLANVSRQTAEDVSSQMTAIWNNFDDGTHNLEYYADVITALGAATASSSQEIAKGMQQFAAVADTVGLSYEYAAASLATIVSVTRQSESTVGNGLRTIFSRLEGLKLGDTLEDGTDLTKYSEALAVIGVNIKDASGQLKDMDTILEETAGKWDKLDKAQKVAFATTVGGVRQYTNLIALLDNWDTVQQNIDIAKGSEGTLQEQADIYAQSWEAAEKRVRAAAQKIYKDLIDEKFFIKLGDFFTTALNGVDNFINAIGGIPGVIAGVGVILTTVFGKQLSESINSAMYEFSRFTGKAEDIANIQRQDAIKSINDYYNTGDGSFSLTSALLKQEVYNSYELQKVTAGLTDQQKAYAQEVLKTAEQYHKVAIESEKVYNNTGKQLANARGTLANDLGKQTLPKGSINEIKIKGSEEVKELEVRIKSLISELAGAKNIGDNSAYNRYVLSLEAVKRAQEEILQETQKIEAAEDKENVSTEKLEQAKIKLARAESLAQRAKAEMHDSYQLEQQDIEAIADFIIRENDDLDINREKLIALIRETNNYTKALEDKTRTTSNASKKDAEFKEQLDKLKTGFQDIGTGAVGTLKGISQLSMGITSIKGAMDALNDTDLTFFEKFSRVSMGFSIGLSQLAAGLPVLTTGLKSIGTGLMNVIPLASSAGASLTAAFGATAGPIMAAVGAIGLLIGTVLALKAAWENFTPEGKLAVAKKEAEKSQKALDDATQSVENFKSAFDNWQSLYDKMGELTQGTQEYREAVLKANEAALDLINTYDLLKGSDWNLDENGNYRISEEGLNKLQTKREEILRDNYSKKIDENNANLDVSASQTAKNLTRMSNGIGVGSQDLFNLANNYNQTSDVNAIRDFGIQIGIAGTELNNFVEEVQKFAGEIEENASKNEAFAREIELSENRAKGPESYNSQADSLYGKYLNTYQGVNGEITKEQAEADTNNLGQLTGEKITEVYENALKSIKSDDIDDSTKQQLALSLAEAQLKGSKIVDLSGIDTSNWTEEFIKKTFGENASKIQDAVDRNAKDINLEEFDNKISDVHKILKKLSDGAIIEEKDYAALEAASKNTSQYFTKMLDGTYKLTGSAEEFFNLVHKESVESAKEQLQNLQERKQQLQDFQDHKGLSANYAFNDENSMLYQSAWGRTSEGDQITGYKDASDASGFNSQLVNDQLNLLSQLDQSSEMATKIDSWKEGGYTKKEAEEIAAAILQYKDALSNLNEEQKAVDAESQTLMNGIASLSTSLNELTTNFSSGLINGKAYNVGLQELASQYDNCAEELKHYNDALASGNAEQATAAHEALRLAIAAGEIGKKYNLTSEELESMSRIIKTSGKAIEGLSDDVKENGKECVELAKDITRYDKAVQSVTKNIQNWNKALSGDNLQDQATAITEMSSAYGDLLDLDGSQLSANFLTDTDNLQLMQDAVNGVDGAYESLLEKANEDLTAGIRDSLSGDALYNFEAGLNSIDALLKVAGFDAMQAGEDINAALNNLQDPHISNDRFLRALEEMVNAAGMTADQATNYLSSMGIDAEVVNEPETITETVGYNLTPKITPVTQSYGPAADGSQTATASYPQVEYTSEPVEVEKQVAGTGLKVTSAHKSSGGNVKHANSSHASGNGKSGGKGGGGGGKGSKAPKKKDLVQKKEKDKKRFEDEEERYHEINEELERTSHLLDMIGKEKDRAFGRNKIKNLNSENDLLKKQVSQYKELKKQAEAYRKTDVLNLAKYGAQIGSNGVINNYTEMLAAEVDRYNAAYDAYIDAQNKAIEEYNAKLVDGMEDAAKEAAEDELEAAKKAADAVWEKAKEYYDDFSKNVSKYEETVKKAEEAEEAIREAENQVYDNELQKITYIVELKIDIEDRDIALLQDYLEDIGDKADGATDAIINFGNQLDDTLNKVDHYTDEVSKILEHAGADDDLIDDVLNGTFDEDQWNDILSIGQDGKGLNEEEIEKLKSAADALLSMNKELRQLREEALKKTGEAFDEFNEKLERGVSQIEHLTKVTQTYRDVLDIIGKDVLDRNGKLTSALNEQAYNIQRNHTHALQAQLDFIDSALDDAQRLYDEAVQNGYNQQVLDSLRADVEKYEDQRQNTYESWLDSWKEECQLAKNYYEDTLNQILQNFEDAIAGQFKNLSNLSEEFARKNEISSIYVEDYEKIYQLSKLTRDINNSLDDSTTLASKGKLRDIQKEINALQESGLEVSQYDLDVLRKKYEMAIAYEQWQDAQNAKTVVRMQRDNEGNYGYVYTADQSDVEAAEQNYEDKLHEMQTLNAEYIQSLQEQIIQAQQDCADALANLRAEDYASYEEYQAAVEQIRSDYTERIQTLSQQMENALDNNRNLYEIDWTEYSKATGYKISADEEYIDKFEETVYSQLTGFQTMEEAQSAFVDAVNDASDAAAESWEDWYIRTNTALDDAGLSMQNFTDEVSDRVEELGEDAERAEEDVWNMSNEFADAYSDISDTVGNFLGEYSNYIDSMINYNQALVDSINDVLRAYAELEGSEFDNDQNNVIEGEWDKRKDENGNEYWYVQDKKTKQAVNGENVKISWAGDEHTQGYTTTYNVINGVMQTEGRQGMGTGGAGTTFTDEELKKLHKSLSQFDTGGYTGDWGDSNGRLALLHEKELVLNADDTANILSAVDMIRSISNAIDLNALAAGAVFAGRGAAVTPSFGNETLEQNVHITAEFPSVSDHNEIEEALNSLVERAAQFAGRKKF